MPYVDRCTICKENPHVLGCEMVVPSGVYPLCWECWSGKGPVEEPKCYCCGMRDVVADECRWCGARVQG